MNIGFTYDLKSDYIKNGFTSYQCADMDEDKTIDKIVETLESIGHLVDKIGNIYNLVKKINSGENWDIVFNIAEGYYGAARECQIPALLDAYQIPYTFSDSIVHGISLNKEYTKDILSKHLKTVKSFKFKNISEVDFNSFEYPIFLKPNSEGSSKGIKNNSKVNSKEEFINTYNELKEISNDFIIAEEFLSGREFTVGVVGNGDKLECIGVMEILFLDPVNNFYSYENKQDYKKLIEYDVLKSGELFEKCKEMAFKSFEYLGCKDICRIDIRLDKNDEPTFIEINTLPGLNFEDSDIVIMAKLNGISYEELMSKILTTSIERNFKK